MPFWDSLGKVAKGAVGWTMGAVEDAASWTGQRTADASGMSRIAQHAGEYFGQNMKLTLEGLEKFPTKFEVKVTFAAPDLIAAANLLRDGLRNFDVFGGALRNARADYDATRYAQATLRELRTIVRDGVAAQTQDDFFVELTLLNATTKVEVSQTPTPLGEMYRLTVEQPCACAVTISVNGDRPCELSDIRIPASSAHTSETLRVDRTLNIRHLVRDGRNDILVQIDPPNDLKGGGAALLKEARLRVLLVRRTTDWKHILAEWVFDGSSGATSFSGTFPLNDDTWSAKPPRSPKVDSVEQKILMLVDTLSPGKLVPEAPGPSGGMADVIQTTLLRSYRERTQAEDQLQQELRSIQPSDPSTFDIRMPITVAVTCLEGAIRAAVSSRNTQTKAELQVVNVAGMSGGDKVASFLPLAAGPRVPRSAIGKHSLLMDVTSPNQGRCTVAVYVGFDWFQQLVFAQTAVVDATHPWRADVPLSISDPLA